MNNSIQENYGEMAYNMPVKNRGSKQAGMTAGSFLDMVSQAVAIGEDGSIVNAQAHSSGGEITQSSDEMVRAYYLRLAKRAEFMRWLAKEQIKDSIEAASMAEAADAKARLAEMMNNGRLKEIFGDTIAGMPTQTVLAITKAQVWG